MTQPLKIKVDFDGEKTKALLNFITETQEGKYTVQKPDLTQVTYKQLEIQEQDKSHIVDENNEEIILFGISY
ncbi:MAG: hypothetical protein NTY96_00755 [Bacteroidetes bacterium]|nr:hypothetical protein [Bacteroidota bacterium]